MVLIKASLNLEANIFPALISIIESPKQRRLVTRLRLIYFCKSKKVWIFHFAESPGKTLFFPGWDYFNFW